MRRKCQGILLEYPGENVIQSGKVGMEFLRALKKILHGHGKEFFHVPESIGSEKMISFF